MFNCKFAIAQLAAAMLVSSVATAHAQEKAEKADVGMLAATADVQPAKVAKSPTRSRYGNNSGAMVPLPAVKRPNQHVRVRTSGSVGATVSATQSASATKRSRYPISEVTADNTRVAAVKP